MQCQLNVTEKQYSQHVYRHIYRRRATSNTLSVEALGTAHELLVKLEQARLSVGMPPGIQPAEDAFHFLSDVTKPSVGAIG